MPRVRTGIFRKELCSRVFRYESSNGPSIVYVARTAGPRDQTTMRFEELNKGEDSDRGENSLRR